MSAAVADIVFRPVQAHDGALIDGLVRKLSPQSRVRRFHGGVVQLPPDLLYRFTHPDPATELALLAFGVEPASGREVCVGEARYVVSMESPCEREFALAVADEWQGRGIGSGLLRALTQHAQEAGIERLYGDVLRDNLPMLALAESLGYRVGRHPAELRLLRVSRVLDDVAGTAPRRPPCRQRAAGVAGFAG